MTKKSTKPFSGVRMQLVASVFVAIAPVLVLTCVVDQPWSWQYSPDWLHDYFVDVPWVGLTVGLFALVAAWFGCERFILRQVRALLNAARRLGQGDMTSRTGLRGGHSELGQLALAFDNMAESLQQRGGWASARYRGDLGGSPAQYRVGRLHLAADRTADGPLLSAHALLFCPFLRSNLIRWLV